MSLIEKIAHQIAHAGGASNWPHALECAQAALTAIMGEGDGVQQCDREAAHNLMQVIKGNDSLLVAEMRAGAVERHFSYDAFARHRSTAAAAERARIVAWLRATCYGDPAEAKAFAGMIEEGETE